MPSWLLTSVQISIHKFKIQASAAICFLATIWKEEKPKADVQVGEKLSPGLASFAEFQLCFLSPPQQRKVWLSFLLEAFQPLCHSLLSYRDKGLGNEQGVLFLHISLFSSLNHVNPIFWTTCKKKCIIYLFWPQGLWDFSYLTRTQSNPCPW